MPLYQVTILAVVQGFTEFLPISSTAHLFLTSWLLGWRAESLEFDIALHIGTLAAVLIYFFRDWLQILAQGFGIQYGNDAMLRQNRGLLWLLVIGTIPVVIFGLLFGEQAETTWRNPMVMGTTLVLLGVLMWIADRRSRLKRDMAAVNMGDAGTIGLSQALAIIPGTSRSGITITAALFRGLDRESAARFSFLLSTPAIAGAATKALWDLIKHGSLGQGMLMPFVVGVIVSGITGAAVIAWFLRFLRRRSLAFFAYYRVIFGIIVLALALIRG